MTLSAPPRPPRPGDPISREEAEALVEALIEEAQAARAAAPPEVRGLRHGRHAGRRRGHDDPRAEHRRGGRIARAGRPVERRGSARPRRSPSSPACGLAGVGAGDVVKPPATRSVGGKALRRERRRERTTPGSSGGVHRCRLRPGRLTAQKLLFQSSGGIHVVNVDGSGLQNLTPDGGSDAAWSPDGQQIAFDRLWVRRARGASSDPEIYVMNADGIGAAEPHAQRGGRPRSGLVARWSEDRLPAGRRGIPCGAGGCGRYGHVGHLCHECRRQRSSEISHAIRR